MGVTNAMAYETIILERSGVIGKITFNRPDVLNAYNKTLSNDIIKGFKELAEDDSVRVIVLTGSGRAFMAGADINMVNGWAALGNKDAIKKAVGDMLDPTVFEDCPKPVIAAINGLTFGMGCEIAMACDFRIAVENAKFGQPEIKLGIIPGAGGTQRLSRLVGITKALELAIIGDPISADVALQLGLITKVVPNDKLWEEVEAFAKRLADLGAVAVKLCKYSVHRGASMPLRDGLNYERDCFADLLLTEDSKEGTKAFIEKRKPQFKGR
jgi:enoyl-CoA hydratase/carnithine racemase